MKFTETALSGAFLIELEPHRDERGFFSRLFCRSEFAKHGLRTDILQCSMAHNPRRGTLRGLHFQLPPLQEVKLVRCTRGSAFDVILDLRPVSPTYCQWLGFELSVENGRGIYIPEGFAHGYITLEDDTDLQYQMSQFFDAQQSRGARYDDPVFGIRWPMPPMLISDRDRTYPDFDPAILRAVQAERSLRC